jgi:hypothetical protein
MEKSPRHEFLYFNDDGDFVAMRYENFKAVFEEQRAPGMLRIWEEPFTLLRAPKFFHLRPDPYERADISSNTYSTQGFECLLNIALTPACHLTLGLQVVEAVQSSVRTVTVLGLRASLSF